MQSCKRIKTLTQSTTAAVVAAGTLALGGVAAAPAAELADIHIAERETALERGLEMAKLTERYQRAYERAERLDVAPKRSAIERDLDAAELRPKLKRLRSNVTEAAKERRAERRAAKRAGLSPSEVEAAAKGDGAKAPSPESVGVSQGTLESIAACESGGDPSAVSPDGTYRGKYQFDHSTWASVGGSGDPAAASEAEQDHRAALLYQRAGHSPWPVCG